MKDFKLGNRDTARANSTSGESVVRIELSKIRVRKEFNVRQDFGDLDSLAESILQNGQTVPGWVDVLQDGKFMLTDGHRRFEAIKLLAKQGHKMLFKAFVNTKDTTEEHRIILMFTSQDNKQLLPIEACELVKRLMPYSNDNASEIARKLGKSPSWVSDMLALAAEPESIKQVVRTGKMTANTAKRVRKEIPSTTERSERVTTEADNRSKVKSHHVTGHTESEKRIARIADQLVSEGFCEEEQKEAVINLLTRYL